MMKTPWWTQKKCWTTDEIRDFVMNNRQHHIDALVEAGVLEVHRSLEKNWYAVVQPHVHEWRATPTHAGHTDDALLRIHCSCGLTDWVSTRLPIEVPND